MINKDTHYYKVEDVKAMADGRWLEILGCIGGNLLDPAISRLGRHVPCPVHGGTDGFRLMPKVAEKGAGVCNTCGFFSDGLALLEWLDNGDFTTILNEVGDFVDAEQKPRKGHGQRQWAQKKAEEKASTPAPKLVSVSPAQPAPAQPSSGGGDAANYLAAKNGEVDAEPSAGAASYLAAKNGEVDPQPVGDASSMNDLPPVDAYDIPEEEQEQSISAFAEEWASGAMMTACGEQVAPQQSEPPTAQRGHVEVRPAQAQQVSAKPAPAASESSKDAKHAVSESENASARSAWLERIKHKTRAQQADKPAPASSNDDQLATEQERRKAERREWLREIQERQQEKTQQGDERSVENIRRTWEESLPITSEAAQKGRNYLISRGIKLGRARFFSLTEGESFRFHPNLAYYTAVETEKPGADGKVVKDVRMVKQGDFPALICAIRDPEGNIVTLHRTYLSKDGWGKAPVESAKKMMSLPSDQLVTGGAIRLSTPSDGVLAVAEGLETALSGLRGTGLPTWCLVNTTLLEKFVPPEGVHTLVVWADKDKSGAGEVSAEKLRSRMLELGIKVVTLLPPMPIPEEESSVDWNDVLNTQGLLGFPRQQLLQRWLDA